MAFDILFDENIRAAAPGLRVLAFEAEIANTPTPDSLWTLIEDEGRRLHEQLPLDQVNRQPGIAPTRAAYKACGKDPNRYRPSAEALTRRLVKGMDLYRTLLAIDLINLVSVRTGHSIGGFDADHIDGNVLTLGVGRQGEDFEAIGRGPLNIAGLPVYRDATGGIGTPTSDCERTKLSPSTTRLLMLVNVYDADADIDDLQSLITDLFTTYGCSIINAQCTMINAQCPTKP